MSDYKVIKRVNPVIDEQFEIHRDGTKVRHIATGKEYTIPAGKAILLKGKTYSAKTLYRRAWYKPLPGTEVKKKAPKVEVVKEKIPKNRKVKKPTKGMIVARAKQLMSQIAHNELEESTHQRVQLGSSGLGVEVLDGKKTSISVILRNPDTGDLLVRILCQNWRAGRWFYSLHTKQYKAFDPDLDKTGYGNDKVIWPKLS